MFRKVQLKFFSIIISILLAIFIAVLGSVNIIMDTVMEHQTRIVLEQVAAGVEYDGVSGRFFIERPDDENWRRFDDYQRAEPPSKPERQPSDDPEVPTETTTSSTAAETTTVTATVTAEQEETTGTEAQTERQTEAPTQEYVPEQTTREIQTRPPQTRTPETQPPRTTQATRPPETQAPPRTSQTQPPETTAAQGGGKPPFWGPWGPFPPWVQPPPWANGGGDDDRNERDNDDDNQYWHGNDNGDGNQYWHGAIMLMSDNGQVPVLDGYTIVSESSGETQTTTADSSKEQREHVPPVDPGEGGSVPRTLGSIDFFLVMADENGKCVGIQNNDDMTEEAAQQYIDEILAQKSDTGMANNYQFCTEKKANGTLLVFTDKSAEIDMMKKLKRTTVIVGLISIILLSAASYYLSGIIVRPIQEAFDKQKQFISDASHELKTPLTVISANADVLEGEIGENKWLNYIQDQADRMNVLVNDLLNLTRLENNTSNFVLAEFDLSKAVENTALPFECRAFESGKNFVLNIEEGIRITGSEQHIKQMAAIFIDNALKYSKENGTVRVSLTNEGGKVRFSVYNTGTGLKESEKEKVFERFYRSDASRNRATGGYGLGLAIARSIIDRHKFRLTVDNAEGKSVCFIVTMN